jgi:hypothetical protein
MHHAGDAVGLSKVFEQLEILKEQLQSGQQQQLTEQQLLLQLLTEQQQNYQGLILDLFHPTSSIASSKELRRYRDAAFVFYYGSSSCAAYTCMVTGMECSARELVAGHIYRQQWPKSLLVSKCLPTNMGQRSWRSSKAQTRVGWAFWQLSVDTGGGFEEHDAFHAGGFAFGIIHPCENVWLPCLCCLQAKVGVTLHDPSNIIIMQSQLEKAFDKWQWIVLPDGPDDYKVVEWY